MRIASALAKFRDKPGQLAYQTLAATLGDGRSAVRQLGMENFGVLRLSFFIVFTTETSDICLFEGLLKADSFDMEACPRIQCAVMW